MSAVGVTKVSVLVLAVAAAAGAILLWGPFADHRAFTDSAGSKVALQWMNPPPLREQFTPLDPSKWRAVTSPKESQAEATLGTASYAALTQEQAVDFDGGYSPSKSESEKPFLFRGLASPQWKGPSHVAFSETNADVSVSGGALSHHPIELRRRCFVGWLDFSPRHVYVAFSVAE